MKIMENSKIAWTHHSFNPWIGCQHVSPGCDHCYAERDWDHRFHHVKWGPHGPRKRTTDDYWKGPPRWNREAEETGKRFRVFCASLADWLDNKVPRSWRDDLAQVIHDTPNLDWLMLTKRIENFDKLARFGLITCAALPQRLHIAMGYILSCKICRGNKGRI